MARLRRRELDRVHTVPSMPSLGWKPLPAYRLKLYRFDGSLGVRELAKGTTYAQAIALRDEELATGRYEKIWLFEVN